MLSNVLEHYHLDQVKYKITQRSSLLLRGTLRKQDNKPDNKSMYFFSMLFKNSELTLKCAYC